MPTLAALAATAPRATVRATRDAQEEGAAVAPAAVAPAGENARDARRTPSSAVHARAGLS